MSLPVHLMGDDTMKRFIKNGYITVKTDFPPDFHAAIYGRIEEILDKEGNPGNNLLPRIPEIQEVFDHPLVHGALTSILGKNYYLHPHRYCHYNPPGNEGQRLHKDSWTKRHHRTRWAMAFYYPQPTTVDMGPTGVVPGSQYYNTGPGTRKEMPAIGDAGAVTIVHYDLWHRAMPNTSIKKRFMVKFLFARLEEPEAPSWKCETPEWPESDVPEFNLWRSIWNWHAGRHAGSTPSSLNDQDATNLVKGLHDTSERRSLQAAYGLSNLGKEGLEILTRALKGEDEAVRRSAGYGLTALGAEAVEGLVDIAQDAAQQETARTSAIDTLGDIGGPASATLPCLIDALTDASVSIRRAAADALGAMNGAAQPAIPAMIGALKDKDEWVRRNTALAFLRMGRAAEEGIPALKAALHDENRYVRAKAAKALERIGTPEALLAALHFYEAAMWCPITTKDRPF